MRLLFESFGGTAFITVNTSDEDWEKALTMTNAHKALKRLRAESRLDTAEFNAITNALEDPAKSDYQELVVRYRNCVAHRVRPSIDHWELSPVLQNREGKPIFDSDGNKKRTSWAVVAHPNKPDFDFTALYEAMKDYLMHVYTMLTGLKAVPRLA